MRTTFILEMFCVLFWIITYVLIIKKSFKDRAYGMPMIACALNISAEIYNIFFFESGIYFKGGSFIWFSLDLMIFYQIIIFFPYKENNINNRIKLSVKLSTVAVLWFLVMYYSRILGLWMIYSNFFQNFLMSLMFIDFIKKRNNLKGQSRYIAFFKFLGTLCVILVVIINGDFSTLSIFYKSIILSIPVLDLIYLKMILDKK